jgi:haloacetate dehalogenase
MDSMWNKVAGQLSEKYTVVCADLRGESPFSLQVILMVWNELKIGYGRSSKPPGSSTHIEYSKRELANDLVQLMSHFNFEKFNILAHDRGARVAHRLCLDHPKSVEKVVLLDIAPTLWMYERTDVAFVSLLLICLIQ